MALNNIQLGLECPYCGRATTLDVASSIYGIGAEGYVRRCEPCYAYVGCHKNSRTSKGRIAKAKLRELKIDAHTVFDKIWKNWEIHGFASKNDARNLSYVWLARKMNLPTEETHIGMFDEEQCQTVINLCKTLICDDRTLNEIAVKG